MAWVLFTDYWCSGVHLNFFAILPHAARDMRVYNIVNKDEKSAVNQRFGY